MRQVVFIPAWRRPDFLLACLKLIQKAKGWEDNLYFFSFDREYDPECLKVYKEFKGEKRYTFRQHTTHGNSFNMIRGYEDCLNIMKREKIELCNMIETDIFVSEDYFTWHEAVNGLGDDHFFVSACRNQNKKEVTGEDPTEVYKHNAYQSLGVSWKFDALDSWLNRTYHPSNIKLPGYYFRDTKGFCKRAFPNSRFGEHCTEQDGLIDRIIEADNLWGYYAKVPRAFHAGYHGYNRRGKPIDFSLSLEERAEMLIAMPEEEMNRRAAICDIARCDLDGRKHLKTTEINVCI